MRHPRHNGNTTKAAAAAVKKITMGFILHDIQPTTYIFYTEVFYYYSRKMSTLLYVERDREKPFSCDFELLLDICHCGGMAASLCYKQIFCLCELGNVLLHIACLLERGVIIIM